MQQRTPGHGTGEQKAKPVTDSGRPHEEQPRHPDQADRPSVAQHLLEEGTKPDRSDDDQTDPARQQARTQPPAVLERSATGGPDSVSGKKITGDPGPDGVRKRIETLLGGHGKDISVTQRLDAALDPANFREQHGPMVNGGWRFTVHVDGRPYEVKVEASSSPWRRDTTTDVAKDNDGEGFDVRSEPAYTPTPRKVDMSSSQAGLEFPPTYIPPVDEGLSVLVTPSGKVGGAIHDRETTVKSSSQTANKFAFTAKTDSYTSDFTYRVEVTDDQGIRLDAAGADTPLTGTVRADVPRPEDPIGGRPDTWNGWDPARADQPGESASTLSRTPKPASGHPVSITGLDTARDAVYEELPREARPDGTAHQDIEDFFQPSHVIDEFEHASGRGLLSKPLTLSDGSTAHLHLTVEPDESRTLHTVSGKATLGSKWSGEHSQSRTENSSWSLGLSVGATGEVWKADDGFRSTWLTGTAGYTGTSSLSHGATGKNTVGTESSHERSGTAQLVATHVRFRLHLIRSQWSLGLDGLHSTSTTRIGDHTPPPARQQSPHPGDHVSITIGPQHGEVVRAVPHETPAPATTGDHPPLDPNRLTSPVTAQRTTFLHFPGSPELEDHIVREMWKSSPGVLPPPEAIHPGTAVPHGEGTAGPARITPEAWENLRSLRWQLAPSQLRGAGPKLLQGTYRITLDLPRLLGSARAHEILIKAEPSEGVHVGSAKSTTRTVSTRTTGADKSVTRSSKHVLNLAANIRSSLDHSDVTRGFGIGGLDVTAHNPSHGITVGFETEVKRQFTLETDADTYAHPVTYHVMIGVEDPERPTTRLSTVSPSSQHVGQVEPDGRLTVEVARGPKTPGGQAPPENPELDVLPQRHAIRHVTASDLFRDRARQSLVDAFEKKTEASATATLLRAKQAVSEAVGTAAGRTDDREGARHPGVPDLNKALDGMTDDEHLRSMVSASHGGWANSGDEQVGSGRNRDTIGLSTRTRLSNFKFRETLPGEGELEIETTSSTSTTVADKVSRGIKGGIGYDPARHPSQDSAAPSLQVRGGAKIIKGGIGRSSGENVNQKTTTSRKAAYKGTWHVYEAVADVTVQGRVTDANGIVTLGAPQTSEHQVLVLLSHDDLRTPDTGPDSSAARRAPLLDSGLLGGAIADIPKSDEILGEIDRQIRKLDKPADVPETALPFAGTFSPENLSANYDDLVGRGILDHHVHESRTQRVITQVLVRAVPLRAWADEGDHSTGDTTRKVGFSQTVKGSAGRDWSAGSDGNLRLSYAPTEDAGWFGSVGWAPSLSAQSGWNKSAETGVTTKTEHTTSKFGDTVKFGTRMRFEVTVTQRTGHGRFVDPAKPRPVDPPWRVHVHVPKSLTETAEPAAAHEQRQQPHQRPRPPQPLDGGDATGGQPGTASLAERDRWQASLDSAHDLVGFDNPDALFDDAQTLLTAPRPQGDSVFGRAASALHGTLGSAVSAVKSLPAAFRQPTDSVYGLHTSPRGDALTVFHRPTGNDYGGLTSPRDNVFGASRGFAMLGHGLHEALNTASTFLHWAGDMTLEAATRLIKSFYADPRLDGSTSPLVREQLMPLEQQVSLRQVLSPQTLSTVLHQLKDPANGYRTVPIGSDGRTGLELHLRPTGEAEEVSTRESGSDALTVSTEHESSTTATTGRNGAFTPLAGLVITKDPTFVFSLPTGAVKAGRDETFESTSPVTHKPGVPTRTLTPPTVPHGKAATEPGKATLKGPQVLMRQSVRLTTQKYDENGTYGNTADTDGHVYYWAAKKSDEETTSFTAADSTRRTPDTPQNEDDVSQPSKGVNNGESTVSTEHASPTGTVHSTGAGSQESTVAPAPRLRVPGDGRCLLYSVLASTPPEHWPPELSENAHAQHRAVLREIEEGPSTVGSDTALGSSAEALRRMVLHHVQQTPPAELPFDVTELYRRSQEDELWQQLRTENLDALRDRLAGHGVDHVTNPDWLHPRTLRDLYVEARTQELMGAPHRLAPRVAARQAADEVPETTDSRGNWGLADSALSPQKQFDHVTGLSGPLPLDHIDNADQLRGAVVDSALRQPLTQTEHQALIHALQNWDDAWNTDEGEMFPALVAHTLGIRLRTFQSTGDRTVLLRPVGPEQPGRTVDVYYNGHDHYDASRGPKPPTSPSAPPEHTTGTPLGGGPHPSPEGAEVTLPAATRTEHHDVAFDHGSAQLSEHPSTAVDAVAARVAELGVRAARNSDPLPEVTVDGHAQVNLDDVPHFGRSLSLGADRAKAVTDTFRTSLKRHLTELQGNDHALVKDADITVHPRSRANQDRTGAPDRVTITIESPSPTPTDHPQDTDTAKNGGGTTQQVKLQDRDEHPADTPEAAEPARQARQARDAAKTSDATQHPATEATEMRTGALAEDADAPTTPRSASTQHPAEAPRQAPPTDEPAPPLRKRRADQLAGAGQPVKRPRTTRHENTDAVLRDRGLIPPRPEEHRLVRERAAALGRFAAPDRSLLSAITRGFAGPNCGETVEAYRDTWYGRARAAGILAGDGPEHGFAWTVYKRHDEPLSYGQGIDGFDTVLRTVRDGGPGSFATVLAGDHGRVGHDWALVHTDDHQLLWIDVHGGTVHPAVPGRPPAGLPPHTRVWASAADRDEARLTGTGRHDPHLLRPDHERPEARFGMPSDAERDDARDTAPTSSETDAPSRPRERLANLRLDDTHGNDAHRKPMSRTRKDSAADEEYMNRVREGSAAPSTHIPEPAPTHAPSTTPESGTPLPPEAARTPAENAGPSFDDLLKERDAVRVPVPGGHELAVRAPRGAQPELHGSAAGSGLFTVEKTGPREFVVRQLEAVGGDTVLRSWTFRRMGRIGLADQTVRLSGGPLAGTSVRFTVKTAHALAGTGAIWPARLSGESGIQVASPSGAHVYDRATGALVSSSAPNVTLPARPAHLTGGAADSWDAAAHAARNHLGRAATDNDVKLFMQGVIGGAFTSKKGYGGFLNPGVLKADPGLIDKVRQFNKVADDLMFDGPNQRMTVWRGVSMDPRTAQADEFFERLPASTSNNRGFQAEWAKNGVTGNRVVFEIDVPGDHGKLAMAYPPGYTKLGHDAPALNQDQWEVTLSPTKLVRTGPSRIEDGITVIPVRAEQIPAGQLDALITEQWGGLPSAEAFEDFGRAFAQESVRRWDGLGDAIVRESGNGPLVRAFVVSRPSLPDELTITVTHKPTDNAVSVTMTGGESPFHMEWSGAGFSHLAADLRGNVLHNNDLFNSLPTPASWNRATPPPSPRGATHEAGRAPADTHTTTTTPPTAPRTEPAADGSPTGRLQDNDPTRQDQHPPRAFESTPPHRDHGPRAPWAAPGPGSKRTRKESGIEQSDSPPPRQQATRTTRSGRAGMSVKGEEKAEEIGNPTLRFTSRYTGPTTQWLARNQDIDFAQEATLQRPDGMTRPAADAYDFWQEVTDRNTQITPNAVNYRPKAVPRRPWRTDGPFRPPYNDEDGTIDRLPDHVTFIDRPGFAGSVSMTNGYWLCSYEVKFRWKVRRKLGGRFNTTAAPAWTSHEMVHRVESRFDPQNPEAPAEIIASAAGDHTWEVELPD
ncbi:toxin glutamine deamidase domain-containing protein [Streptomyces sp. MUM 2J]|uniref:toxin glutamine deamidase domain-containing protein n=1 Tax=Streptomyces sp. MUM 2J TaxID=2791987 RepID=UPI001F03CB3C|nr:toxin glutamine deamidase domain-containing protein [Streptomyces sp. MUM 2J]